MLKTFKNSNVQVCLGSAYLMAKMKERSVRLKEIISKSQNLLAEWSPTNTLFTSPSLHYSHESYRYGNSTKRHSSVMSMKN